MIDPGLRGKTILITGANSGIGAAAARQFGEQGANVFLAFFRVSSEYSDQALKAARQSGVGGKVLHRALQREHADLVAADVRNAGARAFCLEADLSKAENIPLLFDSCEHELGPVDVLVNNHTHCVLETFDPDLVTDDINLLSAKVVDDHFFTNTRAYALAMSEYVKRYLDRGAASGCIINLSTDAAHAHVWNVSYAASKHAIESYSRSAAAELGKYGIRVNIVAPGPIQTGYITPEAEIELEAGIPLGRLGTPDDVAIVIVFLASEQARWLTGQLLYVGGGWRMHQ